MPKLVLPFDLELQGHLAATIEDQRLTRWVNAPSADFVTNDVPPDPLNLATSTATRLESVFRMVCPMDSFLLRGVNLEATQQLA